MEGWVTQHYLGTSRFHERDISREAVSPAGCHDNLYMVQENRTAELKLKTEGYLDRKRGCCFQNTAI